MAGASSERVPIMPEYWRRMGTIDFEHDLATIHGTRKRKRAFMMDAVADPQNRKSSKTSLGRLVNYNWTMVIHKQCFPDQNPDFQGDGQERTSHIQIAIECERHSDLDRFIQQIEVVVRLLAWVVQGYHRRTVGEANGLREPDREPESRQQKQASLSMKSE